jgi:Flp pilus assembly protein TadG
MMLRYRKRDETGAAAVELALILPVLALILFGTEEFGRLLWTKSLLDHAVDEAARCGSVNSTTCGSSSAIASYAVQRSAPLTLSTSVFTATTPSCGSQVAASYPFTFAAPTLLPFTVTLRSQACFPK